MASCAPLVLRRAELGVRRNPVWRDSSNVKRERAVGDGYGIEGMGSDSGILFGIILNFCHFLSDLKGLTLEVEQWRHEPIRDIDGADGEKSDFQIPEYPCPTAYPFGIVLDGEVVALDAVLHNPNGDRLPC